MQLLTLGAHAAQGYSSCVCVCVCVCVCLCVCVCVQFDFPYSNELAKKTYGSPQRCKRLNQNMGVCVKQPLRKATKFVSKFTSTAVSHCVCLCT